MGAEAVVVQRHPGDDLAIQSIAHDQSIGPDGALLDRRGQVQAFEHLEDIGAELDAGTDLAETARLFQQADRPALPRQRQSGRGAADAATRNQNR